MPEVIHFAIGNSSLGDFVIAMSEKGLVALDFISSRSAAEATLRVRLPDAELVESPEALASVLERARRAIEEPGFDPEIALDLRGSSYEREVWSMVGTVPIGQTTTYGALAAKLGTRDARPVTAAVSSNPIAVIVPCHRVIKKDGSVGASSANVSSSHASVATTEAMLDEVP